MISPVFYATQVVKRLNITTASASKTSGDSLSEISAFPSLKILDLSIEAAYATVALTIMSTS